MPKRLLFVSALAALIVGGAVQAEDGPPATVEAMTSQYKHGQYQAAHRIGCRILADEPSNLAVHYLLGNCFVKFGQLDKAREEYKYCALRAYGTPIGTNAQKALDQLNAPAGAAPATSPTPPAAPSSQAATAPTANQATSIPATSNSATSIPTNSIPTSSIPTNSGPASANKASATATAVEKIDLQTLEYKERIIKEGVDLIASNKSKLEKQIESIERETALKIELLSSQSSNTPGGENNQAEINHLQQDCESKIRMLRENNDSEELKITAFYKAQADSIGQQKGNLSSQAAAPGNSDVRLRAKGSSLFVRHYVNYHGEVPPPPPPEELKARALPLTQRQHDAGKKTSGKH